ncbi:PREDICTED: 28S ribosomal protein S29, mitochondrial-like [Priapulus caudatus]|uniref:Small ribosomal subunit protein mS29 n=1 Tax=Priapulus caudatus TaxID=37621 RepID=A0ABM1E3P6_PRICU|nr:PREDICTED: 28S ribosomal protein S29, mitochondrial-like [Priapulus caudatus]
MAAPVHLCGKAMWIARLTNSMRSIYFKKSSSVSHMLSPRLLSTSTHEETVVPHTTASDAFQPHAVCKTNEHDPDKHTENHMSLFYKVQEDEIKRLFGSGGLERQFLIQLKTFQESCFMVRQPAFEVINYLKQSDYSNPAIRYVLYGKKGSGKTVSLAHIIHWCSQQGWLLIHVPSADRFTERVDEVQPSSHNPGRVDLPVVALEWLKRFKVQNSLFLEENEFKTSRSYVWSKRESTEEGAPITNVIEQGINRSKHASDCMNVILREVKLQSKNLRKPVLVAMDGVNHLFWDTAIRREDRTFLPACDVSLVYNLKKLLHNDWSNAAVVTTVDERYAGVYNKRRPSYLPRFLLQKSGFELFDPFLPVLVDGYSEKEALTCINYYIDRHWIQNENGKTDLIKTFDTLTLQGFELFDPFLPVLVDGYSEKEALTCINYYIDRHWIQNENAKTDGGKKELMHLSGFNPLQLDMLCRGL